MTSFGPKAVRPTFSSYRIDGGNTFVELAFSRNLADSLMLTIDVARMSYNIVFKPGP